MKLALLFWAAALYGQTSPDPSEVLDGAREKIRTMMRRLPMYACLETIDRIYYASASSAGSCDQISAEKKKRFQPPRAEATDRVRIEVAQGADQEIHSWPGASRFDLNEIDQIVDNGPFGTGAFGSLLTGVFDNDLVQFDYRGEKTRGAKHVLIFGYSVAPEVSRWEIRAGDSWVTAGYGGTIEVDPQSFALDRLTLETTELPEPTGICQATNTLDYHLVPIGGAVFLLPQESHLRLVLRNGQETDNSSVFSACREFHAESAVRYDHPPVEEVPDSTVPGRPHPPLPAQLGVDLRLQTPIDTDTAAAGDAFTAMVVHAVHPYRSSEVLIPAGAVVHGRLSRVEHHFAKADYWLIGFAFESVEFEGESSPISLRTEPQAHYSGTIPVDALIALLRGAPEPPPDSLMFRKEARHVMPAGTVTHWITRDSAVDNK